MITKYSTATRSSGIDQYKSKKIILPFLFFCNLSNKKMKDKLITKKWDTHESKCFIRYDKKRLHTIWQKTIPKDNNSRAMISFKGKSPCLLSNLPIFFFEARKTFKLWMRVDKSSNGNRNSWAQLRPLCPSSGFFYFLQRDVKNRKESRALAESRVEDRISNMCALSVSTSRINFVL